MLYHTPMSEPNRKPNTKCTLCTAPMYRKPWIMAEGGGKYCSRACRNKAHPHTGPRTVPESMKGANNPAWKGGVTMFKRKGNYKGIPYVRAPEPLRSMARKDGYIMEHRMVMAQWCGYLLTRTEVVHHVDHDPTNNPRNNLELWPTNSAHKLWEHGRFVPGASCRWFPAGSGLL